MDTMTPVTYFVIPCGQEKTTHAAPARDLYAGSMFRHALNSVEAEAAATTTDLGIETRILILSAKHGLIDLDTVLDPYDMRMGNPGCITPTELQAQAAARGIDYGTQVYAFLPAAYRDALNTALRPLDVYLQDVYEAAPGVGYQRGVCSSLARLDDPYPIQTAADDLLWLGNPTGEPAVHEAINAGLIGMVVTPGQGNTVPPGATWFADNGCGPDKHGNPGGGYPGDRAWLTWLANHPAERDDCLFAVAPDVYRDAAATLARSVPFLPAVRALGYRAALVAQDGTEHLTIPWEAFDALFIGGSDPWRASTAVRHLVTDAKQRGKWVHLGRVNTTRGISEAAGFGVDSADGTTLAHGARVNLPRILAGTRLAHDQGVLTLDLVG